MDFVYLVKVEPNANNNKFYRMIKGDSEFTVEFGRVGNTGFQTTSYSNRMWDKKYNEKIKKGYVDQTRLVAEKIEVNKSGIKYKEISDVDVRKIVNRLQQMAKDAIHENYTISSDKVTQLMIDEAEALISKLLTITDINKFNNVLLELFRTIPRKMKSVEDNLLSDTSKIADIIQHEQDLLDVMKGQVAIKEIEESTTDETFDKTILEIMGLEIKPITHDEENLIKKNLGSSSNKYLNAWRIVNLKTQEKFDNFVRLNNIQTKKLLWHGSRNENWWSILRTGLLLKPNAVITGKMFGHGIYFAPKAEKSIGYTSLSGSYWAKGNSKSAFMALFDTAYGIPYNTYNFDSKYYDFNYSRLTQQQNNANCLHAHSSKGMLRNDEIIYYKEEQVTVKYLVEIN